MELKATNWFGILINILNCAFLSYNRVSCFTKMLTTSLPAYTVDNEVV